MKDTKTRLGSWFLLQYVRIILHYSPETFSPPHLKNNFEPVDSNAKQTERNFSGNREETRERKKKRREKERETPRYFYSSPSSPVFLVHMRIRRLINEYNLFSPCKLGAEEKEDKKKETFVKKKIEKKRKKRKKERRIYRL